MADDSSGPLPISGERLFPWLRLVRGIGAAADGRSLILAALGLVLLWAGWMGLDGLFGRDVHGTLVRPWSPAEPSLDRFSTWGPSGGPAEPFRVLTAPFVGLFAIRPGFRALSHSALAAVWGVIVWGILGGAIARIAALRMAGAERAGIVSAVRFALTRAVALIGAPLSPLIGLGFFAALCGLLGLLYRIPGPAGATLAGVLAFLPLLAGLVMALILVGMAVGWPLMVATVAVEGEDAFDAISRSYAYVYQRPARFAFYAAVAWVLGWAGTLLVGGFASLVVYMATWGLAFGGPPDRVAALFGGMPAQDSTPAAVHAFWVAVVRLLAHGWVYSYFWTAATIVYTLLRRDVDGASWHEVAAAGESEDNFAPPTATIEVPPLKPPVLPEVGP